MGAARVPLEKKGNAKVGSERGSERWTARTTSGRCCLEVLRVVAPGAAGSIPVTPAGRRAGRITSTPLGRRRSAPHAACVCFSSRNLYRAPFFAALLVFVVAFVFAAAGFALLVFVVAFALALLGAFAALAFFGAGAGFAVAPLGFASGSGAASCFGAVSTFGGVGGGSAISVVALVTGAAGGELGAGALGAMGAGRGAVDKRSCCGPWCVMCSRSRHRNTIPRSTAASVSCTPVCLTCSCCRRWYS